MATSEGRRVRLPLDEPQPLSQFMALNLFLHTVPVSFRTLKDCGLQVEVDIRNETDEPVPPLEMKVQDKSRFFQPFTIWEIPQVTARGKASRLYRLRLGAGVFPRISKVPATIQMKYNEATWTAHLEVGHFRGQLCDDYWPPSEQYNIAIVGPPGSGKSMLINMIHTMLTAPSNRVSMIAPVRPTSIDTHDGEVHYEPYPLKKKFDVKVTLWEATPFTETTINNPTFSQSLMKFEMPSKQPGVPAKRFDTIIVLLPENYLTDGSPPDSVIRYLRELFDDEDRRPLLCISQTTHLRRNYFEVKTHVRRKLKLGANAIANCKKLSYFSQKEKDRKLDIEVYDILDCILRRASTRSYTQ